MPTDVTTDLIRALIENMRGADDDWESFSMVVYFSGRKFGGTHGYAYSPGSDIYAVASHPSAIRPAVDAYMESHYGPQDAFPVKMLVQFDRAMGRYKVTFEDSDESRWKVTPANLEQIREELRPKFD